MEQTESMGSCEDGKDRNPGLQSSNIVPLVASWHWRREGSEWMEREVVIEEKNVEMQELEKTSLKTSPKKTEFRFLVHILKRVSV